MKHGDRVVVTFRGEVAGRPYVDHVEANVENVYEGRVGVVLPDDGWEIVVPEKDVWPV